MNFIDLFAGVGGFRLGMERAGHKCVGWVECDPKCELCKKITKHVPGSKRNYTICTVCGKEKRQHARFSYEAIHDTEGEWTAYDITTVSDDDLELLRGRNVEVICGGFPCQAFSIAGKRGGFSDTRGTMFFEIARIAKEIKPRYLFLENVKGLLSHDKGNTFGTVLYTLDELGYDCSWQVLNSKNFGVPQNRERVFIVGHLRGTGGREVFPIRGTDGETDIPIKLVAHRKGFHRNTQTFAPDGITETLDTGQGGGRGHYVIVKGNVNPSGNGMNGNVYDSNGLSPTLTTNKGEGPKIVEYDRNNGIGKQLEVAHTLNSSDWRGLNRNQKQNAVAVPVLTPERVEKRQNGRRFKEDGDPMFTLTTQDRHGVYDGFRIRKLTPRECWRLQAFPDWAFDKVAEVNSNSQLYKQAGNSVTVNVIYEIAKRL